MQNYLTSDTTNKRIIKDLASLVQGGFENLDGNSGAVQIFIPAEEVTYPLAIIFTSSELGIQEDWIRHPDATLTLPLDTVKLILESITEVDFRDPEVMGTISLSGDLNLINQVAKSLLRPSQDTLERFELAEQLQTDAYGLTEIPRVTNPTELEILESIATGWPLIISDTKLLKEAKNWSLDRLEAEYGDVPLRVRSADNKETMAEFIARVRATDVMDDKIIEGHTKAYTEGCFLPEPMHSDFLPSYLSRNDYSDPQIWLGSVPINVPASSLHRDPLNGFLYQIIGRKKLIMYAPDQAAFLYTMKAFNNYQPCWVAPEKPDYQRFPEFAKARAIEVELYPGELLVQPAGWFHAVYCLDSPTFSVSYFQKH